MKTHSDNANLLWGPELLSDDFKPGQEDIALPSTVMGRIDSVLESTKEEALESCRTYKGKFEEKTREAQRGIKQMMKEVTA